MGKYQNEDLIEVFEDTRRWCRSEKALREAVEHSLAETKLYSVGEELHYDKSRYAEPMAVSVSTRRTFEAARELHEKLPNAKIAVLNFASATNPGGGVARGSRAQEESLCRCSTLYPVLADPKYWGAFYGFHRKRHDARYTDLCLYTPGVKVIKSDTALPERLDEKDWLSVDVITCAAPNLRERPSNEMNPQAGEALHLSDEELLALHKKRGRAFLPRQPPMKRMFLFWGHLAAGRSATRRRSLPKRTVSSCRSLTAPSSEWSSPCTARRRHAATMRRLPARCRHRREDDEKSKCGGAAACECRKDPDLLAKGADR